MELKELILYLPIIFELLDQNSLNVQVLALELLESLTRRYNDQMKSKAAEIQNALAPMITDHDLSRTFVALKISENLIKNSIDASHH